ncbi:DUF4102 domain-containing protein [Sulfitobacter sp. BDSS02]|nr:DUF4102 domain-containing protein [Sulfitobacter sp. BDSS02]
MLRRLKRWVYIGSLHRLSFKKVTSVPSGKYAEGGGQWFQLRDDGGAQWFVRFTVHGRSREMGLGRYTDVSPKGAREAAEKCLGLLRQKLDLIKERERERMKAARNLHILNKISIYALESRKPELKDDGKAGRWLSPLEHHVLPKPGKVPVANIDQIDIRDVLAAIWLTKADTARKALNRLSFCLRYEAGIGLDVDLQTTEKAKSLLGSCLIGLGVHGSPFGNEW